MKLVNKINYNFLAGSFIVFIIVSVLSYIILDSIIVNEVDEQLVQSKKQAFSKFVKGENVNFPPFIEIIPKHKIKSNIELGFKDVLLPSNDEDGDGEPFREYSTIISKDGKSFILYVRSSIIEKEDLLLSLIALMFGAFLVLIVVMYLLNKSISQSVFKDLNETIHELENFSVDKNKSLVLKESSIEEFSILNKSVELLSQRAISEYKKLKEFTEETNHEIQTPAAIAKSKLELLLQNESLSESDLNQVNTALNNLGKLERINKAILLLNKLENKQHFDESKVNINNEINDLVENYSDFIESKNIMLTTELQNALIVNVNKPLLNILINNLFSNAIKHNTEKGNIIIKMEGEKLFIINSTENKDSNSENFFKRFYRNSNSQESVGLGLTIAKKICDLYNIEIENHLESNTYSIKIDFRKAVYNV